MEWGRRENENHTHLCVALNSKENVAESTMIIHSFTLSELIMPRQLHLLYPVINWTPCPVDISRETISLPKLMNTSSSSGITLSRSLSCKTQLYVTTIAVVADFVIFPHVDFRELLLSSRNFQIHCFT